MDFETAVWEMTHLIIAPKKVFRNIYYHKQTKNSYHRADPAFTYLLSLFLFLTGLAWGLAYADGFGRTLRVALAFVLVHFLGTSLSVSVAMYFLVGRVLGKRRQGLFGPPSGGGLNAGDDALEFGYCFDVGCGKVIDVGGADRLSGCNTIILAHLDVPLRSTVPAHAAHSARLLGVKPLRQHHVPDGAELLFCHYLPGLQW